MGKKVEDDMATGLCRGYMVRGLQYRPQNILIGIGPPRRYPQFWETPLCHESSRA